MDDIQYEELDYVDFDTLKQNIINNQIHAICNHMPAAGMYHENFEELEELIRMCIVKDDEWIRNAAILALYYWNFRTESDDYSMRKMKDIAILGLKDCSPVVNDTAQQLLSDIKRCNPGLYREILKESQSL